MNKPKTIYLHKDVDRNATEGHWFSVRQTMHDEKYVNANILLTWLEDIRKIYTDQGISLTYEDIISKINSL